MCWAASSQLILCIAASLRSQQLSIFLLKKHRPRSLSDWLWLIHWLNVHNYVGRRLNVNEWMSECALWWVHAGKLLSKIAVESQTFQCLQQTFKRFPLFRKQLSETEHILFCDSCLRKRDSWKHATHTGKFSFESHFQCVLDIYWHSPRLRLDWPEGLIVKNKKWVLRSIISSSSRIQKRIWFVL